MKDVITEYDGKEIIVKQFEGKLVSLNHNIREKKNGKQFYLGTIEFVSVHGEVARSMAVINQFSYDEGMTVGERYLCTGTPVVDGVIVSCSHLVYGGGVATPDMFGFDMTTSDVNASTQQKAAEVDAVA